MILGRGMSESFVGVVVADLGWGLRSLDMPAHNILWFWSPLLVILFDS